MDAIIDRLDLVDPTWPAVVEDLLSERGHPRLGLEADLERSVARLWVMMPRGALAAVLREIARPAFEVLLAPEDDPLLRSVFDGDRAARAKVAARAGAIRGGRVRWDRARTAAEALALAMHKPGKQGTWARVLAAMEPLPGGRRAALAMHLRALLRRALRAPAGGLRQLDYGESHPRRDPLAYAIRVERGWLVAPLLRLPRGEQRPVRRRLTAAGPEALGALILEQLEHSRVYTGPPELLPRTLIADATDAALARRFPFASRADLAAIPHARIRGASLPRWRGERAVAAARDRLQIAVGRGAWLRTRRALGPRALGELVARSIERACPGALD